jgi:hypothetical protein
MLSFPLFRLPPRFGLMALIRQAMKPDSLEAHVEQAHAIERRVAAVARMWPVEVSCLRRSLVLIWLLRCHNVEGRLRIGVRKSPSGLLGHAWVDVGGQPVNDSPEHCATFMPLEQGEEPWARFTEAGATI